MNSCSPNFSNVRICALADLAEAESLVQRDRASVPRGDVEAERLGRPLAASVVELVAHVALAEPAPTEVRPKPDPDLDDARLRLVEVPERLDASVLAAHDAEPLGVERRVIARVVEVVRRGVVPFERFGETHAGRSISTKRLSSAGGTSRKPARRYARSARSFQRATQRRK